MAMTGSSTQNRWAMLFMGAVLIFGLAIALFQPAGAFPPTAYVILFMCLDGVMTVLLIMLIIGERRAPPSPRGTMATLVAVAGVLAGAGQLAIRFTSDHAWWTGKYLPPVFN